MSIRLMSLVFDADIEDLAYFKNDERRVAKASTAKLVLLAYADHANDEGEGAYPGYKRLKRKTKLSGQGIADTLEALKQNAFMTLEGWSKLDTHKYSLNKDLLEKLVKPLDKEVDDRVKPLDTAESSHLTQPSQATGLNPSSTSGTSNGASAPPVPLNAGLDWCIGHNLPIPENLLAEQKHRQMVDSANLIAMSAASNEAYNLALAFQEERDIVFPHSKCKGQAKAAKLLVEQHIQPDHVRRAVRKLMDAGLTCTDLYSVERTAVDLANQPDSVVPVIVRADPEEKKMPPPVFAQEEAARRRAMIGRGK